MCERERVRERDCVCEREREGRREREKNSERVRDSARRGGTLVVMGERLCVAWKATLVWAGWAAAALPESARATVWLRGWGSGFRAEALGFRV